MKELSIKEKAERYDEAIKKAKDYHKQLLDEDNPGWASEIEKIFPELKESEDENTDEKVRKALIKLVTNHASMDLFIEYDIHLDEALSWLEKQGEQKLADKVELKFKVGDWVVFNNKHQSIYQVEKIENGYYILRHTHGGTFRVCVLHDESLRLWAIKVSMAGMT